MESIRRVNLKYVKFLEYAPEADFLYKDVRVLFVNIEV